MLLELFILKLPWSTVAYYDNGKTMTVADGLVGANGINVSPDKK